MQDLARGFEPAPSAARRIAANGPPPTDAKPNASRSRRAKGVPRCMASALPIAQRMGGAVIARLHPNRGGGLEQDRAAKDAGNEGHDYQHELQHDAARPDQHDGS